MKFLVSKKLRLTICISRAHLLSDPPHGLCWQLIRWNCKNKGLIALWESKMLQRKLVNNIFLLPINILNFINIQKIGNQRIPHEKAMGFWAPDRGIPKMAIIPAAKAANAPIAMAGEFPPPNSWSHGPLPRETTTCFWHHILINKPQHKKNPNSIGNFYHINRREFNRKGIRNHRKYNLLEKWRVLHKYSHYWKHLSVTWKFSLQFFIDRISINI